MILHFDSMVYLMESFFFSFNFIAINGNPEDDHFDSRGYHGNFFICFIHLIVVYGKLRNQ